MKAIASFFVAVFISAQIFIPITFAARPLSIFSDPSGKDAVDSAKLNVSQGVSSTNRSDDRTKAHSSPADLKKLWEEGVRVDKYSLDGISYEQVAGARGFKIAKIPGRYAIEAEHNKPVFEDHSVDLPYDETKPTFSKVVREKPDQTLLKTEIEGIPVYYNRNWAPLLPYHFLVLIDPDAKRNQTIDEKSLFIALTALEKIGDRRSFLAMNVGYAAGASINSQHFQGSFAEKARVERRPVGKEIFKTGYDYINVWEFADDDEPAFIVDAPSKEILAKTATVISDYLKLLDIPSNIFFRVPEQDKSWRLYIEPRSRVRSQLFPGNVAWMEVMLGQFFNDGAVEFTEENILEALKTASLSRSEFDVLKKYLPRFFAERENGESARAVIETLKNEIMPFQPKPTKSEVRHGILNNAFDLIKDSSLENKAKRLGEKLAQTVDLDMFDSAREILESSSGTFNAETASEVLEKVFPFIEQMNSIKRYSPTGETTIWTHSARIANMSDSLGVDEDKFYADFGGISYKGEKLSDATWNEYAELQQEFFQGSKENRLALRLTALFHDIGVLIQMQSHEPVGAIVVNDILEKLPIAEETKQLILWGVANHLNLGVMGLGERTPSYAKSRLDILPENLRRSASALMTLIQAGEVRSLVEIKDNGKLFNGRSAGFYVDVANTEKFAKLSADYDDYRLRIFSSNGNWILDEKKYAEVKRLIAEEIPKSERQQFEKYLREVNEWTDYGAYIMQELSARGVVLAHYLLSQVSKIYDNKIRRFQLTAPRNAAKAEARGLDLFFSIDKTTFSDLAVAGKNPKQIKAIFEKFKISVPKSKAFIKFDTDAFKDLGNIAINSVLNTETPVVAFVDAADFAEMSNAQKKEFVLVAAKTKSVKIVVYNDNGERNESAAELLKLPRVIATNKDLAEAAKEFGVDKVTAVQISKTIEPKYFDARVGYFKATSDAGGILAVAILWAISGGENARIIGIQKYGRFWAVDETFLNLIQHEIEANYAINIAV